MFQTIIQQPSQRKFKEAPFKYLLNFTSKLFVLHLYPFWFHLQLPTTKKPRTDPKRTCCSSTAPYNTCTKPQKVSRSIHELLITPALSVHLNLSLHRCLPIGTSFGGHVSPTGANYIASSLFNLKQVEGSKRSAAVESIDYRSARSVTGVPLREPVTLQTISCRYRPGTNR